MTPIVHILYSFLFGSRQRTGYRSSNRTMSSLWPYIGLILLIWRAQPVVCLVQNVTVDARGDSDHPRVGGGRLEYLPSIDDWTFSSNVPNAINSSTVRTVRENATLVFHINEPSTFFFWHGFLPESAARYSVCIDCTRLDETGDIVTLTSDATTTDGNRSSPVILYASELLANTTHTVVIRNLRNSIEGVVGQLIVDGLVFTSDLPPNQIPPARTQSSGLIIAVSVVSAITALLLLVLFYLYCIRRIRRRFPDVRNGDVPPPSSPPSWGTRLREIRQRVVCPWCTRPWRRWKSMESRPMIQVVPDQPTLAAPTIAEPVLPIHAKLAQAHRPLSLSRFRPSAPKKSASPAPSPSTSTGSGLFRSFSRRKSKASTRKSIFSTSSSGPPPPLPTKQHNFAHAPVITITSPTTNTNSIYSSAPPSTRSSNAPSYPQERRPERSSRFTVGSVVAYADLIFADTQNGGRDGFASVDDYERGFGRGRGVDESVEGHDYRQRALRESVTLPCLSGHIDRNVSPLPSTSSHPAPKAPPSSFNGKAVPTDVGTGNRAGPKAKRTFSDKLRRGTLPPPPSDVSKRESSRPNTSESTDVQPPQTRRPSVDEPRRASVLRKAPPPSIKSQASTSSGAERPSMMPTFSSGSSTRPGSASTRNALANTSSPDEPNPEDVQSIQPVDAASTFWESNGATFGPSTMNHDLSDSVERENTSLPYLVNEDASVLVPRAPSRQSIQPIPQYRQSLMNSRPSLDRGEDMQPQERVQSPDYPLAGIVASLLEATTELDHDVDRSNSLKSLEPRSLRTARSSAASMLVPTPSVSEFPMPPFNTFTALPMDNHRPPSSHKSSGSDTFTDLLASTPSTFRQSVTNSIAGSSSSKSASGSGAGSTHSRTMSAPPSAFPLAAPLQRTRSRKKNVGNGRPGTAPLSIQPKTSSLSRRGSKKAIAKTSAKNLFARTSPSPREDGNVSSDSSVPFFLPLPLPPPPHASATSLLDLGDDSRAPSRMTTTSVMTDEFASDDVQLVVANRELLSPVSYSRPVIVESLKSATSVPPNSATSAPSSQGQWEIVVPPGPPNGMATIMTGSSYRANGPTAAVPVSARTDAFEGGLYDISLSRKPSANLITPSSQLALDSGNGVMPWSPNFDWPATPPLALQNYYTESVTTSNPLGSNMRLDGETEMITTHMVAGPSSARRRPRKDYPSSIATSNGELWATESASFDHASARESKSSMGHIPWKDLMQGGGADVSRSSSVATRSSLKRQNSANANARESVHSMASTFFKGDNDAKSSETTPPVPALPASLTNLERAGMSRQPLVLNTQQRRWRNGAGQGPGSPQTPSPGTKPIGNVNTIFATSWNSRAPRSTPRSYLPRTSE